MEAHSIHTYRGWSHEAVFWCTLATLRRLGPARAEDHWCRSALVMGASPWEVFQVLVTVVEPYNLSAERFAKCKSRCEYVHDLIYHRWEEEKW